MPVEIRELVIRAVVEPRGQGVGEPDRRGDGGGPAQDGAADHEQLIQECVRQVMRILAAQRER